jgi:hypothetical protein
MDVTALGFPHRVDVSSILPPDTTHLDLIASMARWCYANIGRENWLHDHTRVFEFRNHEDLVLFKITWLYG